MYKTPAKILRQVVDFPQLLAYYLCDSDGHLIGYDEAADFAPTKRDRFVELINELVEQTIGFDYKTDHYRIDFEDVSVHIATADSCLIAAVAASGYHRTALQITLRGVLRDLTPAILGEIKTQGIDHSLTARMGLEAPGPQGVAAGRPSSEASPQGEPTRKTKDQRKAEDLWG